MSTMCWNSSFQTKLKLMFSPKLIFQGGQWRYLRGSLWAIFAGGWAKLVFYGGLWSCCKWCIHVVSVGYWVCSTNLYSRVTKQRFCMLWYGILLITRKEQESCFHQVSATWTARVASWFGSTHNTSGSSVGRIIPFTVPRTRNLSKPCSRNLLEVNVCFLLSVQKLEPYLTPTRHTNSHFKEK